MTATTYAELTTIWDELFAEFFGTPDQPREFAAEIDRVWADVDLWWAFSQHLFYFGTDMDGWKAMQGWQPAPVGAVTRYA